MDRSGPTRRCQCHHGSHDGNRSLADLFQPARADTDTAAGNSAGSRVEYRKDKEKREEARIEMKERERERERERGKCIVRGVGLAMMMVAMMMAAMMMATIMMTTIIMMAIPLTQ